MGDSFQVPGGFPFIPQEPDEPAPKIEDLASSLGIGLEKSGIIGGFLAPLFDILMRWIITAIGWFLSKALTVFAFIIKVVGAVDEGVGGGYGQVVAATIFNVFGVHVDPAVFASRAGTDGKAAAAQKIGKALIRGLFGGVDSASADAIKPSDAAVTQFAGTVTQIELSGWLESWVADAASYHLLEKYGDIKDGIIHAMGISRMSRQAFAPLIKTFLHDPYQALLNNKFRPKPISEGTALDAFFRGTISEDRLDAILGTQGYSPEDISLLTDQHRKYLSLEDITYLVARDTWTLDQATTYLQKLGWDPSSASTIMQIQQDKAQQKYREKAVSIATDAFVKGDIDAGSLQALVDGVGLTEVDKSWIMANAKLQRSTHITHLSLGQIEEGIIDGLMNVNDLKTAAQRMGMPETEETFLELMTLFKLAAKSTSAAAKANAAKVKAQQAHDKAVAAATKAAQDKALAADKGVTVAQAETLVEDGLWTFDHLTQFLTAKGYGSDAIAGIVALLHAKMAKAAASSSAVNTIAATVKAKGLSLQQVQKAVLAKLMTVDQLNAYLGHEGYSAGDARIISELTQQELTTAETKAAAKAAAEAAAMKKHINLAALEHAVRLGLTAIGTYDAALQAAGFDAMSITLLNGILAAQIAADKAKTSGHSTTTVQSAGKAATLQQIANEVVAGIRKISDYTSALGAAGYDAVDQMQLTKLLQLRVDHTKKAAALQVDAAGKAVAKGIPLAAVESAILGGINEFDTYDTYLKALGFDDIDRATLEALLQAKVTAKAAKGG